MTLSDFKKQAHDRWTAKKTIATSIGEFAVRLEMAGKKTPPCDEMLRRADEFVALVRADIEAIHDKTFEHYQTSAGDPDWLKQCGVPSGLGRAAVLAHLQSPVLTVERNDDPAEPFLCRVHLSPDWDEEHGIELAYRNGRWGTQDDYLDSDEPASADGFVPSPSEELVDALMTGDMAKAEKLIAAGMDINALAPDEIPPLWVAVSQVEPNLVGLLLESGADPTLKNPDDKTTPLQLAKKTYRDLGFAPSKKKDKFADIMAQFANTVPGNEMAQVKTKLEEIIALLTEATGK